MLHFSHLIIMAAVPSLSMAGHPKTKHLMQTSSFLT